MSTQKTKTSRYPIAIICYDSDMTHAGDIYSRHMTVENAQKRYDKDFSGTTGVLNHQIVVIKDWDYLNSFDINY